MGRFDSWLNVSAVNRWRTGELLAPMAVVGQLEVSGRWLHGGRGGWTGYMRKGRRLQHKEAGAG